MKICVLPISGGGFPIQLGILCALCDIEYRPHLALGSSGGNLAAYLATAANWNSRGILRHAQDLTQDFFVNSWTPGLLDKFLPSWMVGLLKESFYDSSELGIRYFKEHLNKAVATNTEIWTGTVDCKSKRGQLFCNRDAKESQTTWQLDHITHSDYEPPLYCNGDVEKIARVTLASASIPTVVPPQSIEGKLYSDGGVVDASPLSTMKPVIHNLEDVNDPGLHITYINSFDILQAEQVSLLYSESIHNGKITMFDVVRNFSVKDRNIGISLMRSPDAKTHFCEGVINSKQDLQNVEAKRNKCRRSFIEYYPCKNEIIPLHCFDGKKVVDLCNCSKVKFCYRFWWLDNVVASKGTDQNN
jgi:hypothetical protein